MEAGLGAYRAELSWLVICEVFDRVDVLNIAVLYICIPAGKTPGLEGHSCAAQALFGADVTRPTCNPVHRDV